MKRESNVNIQAINVDINYSSLLQWFKYILMTFHNNLNERQMKKIIFLLIEFEYKRDKIKFTSKKRLLGNEIRLKCLTIFLAMQIEDIKRPR